MIAQVLFWALSAVAVTGAITVVVTRDVTRLTIGLGVFLVAVAGFFAYYGLGLLALAQLFVYVGGVLVLVLFAVMLVHRAEPGKPSLESRHDALVLIACGGFGALMVGALWPLVGGSPTLAVTSSVGAVADVLLGPMLAHFEVAGALLLAALVAVVLIAGGERR